MRISKFLSALSSSSSELWWANATYSKTAHCKNKGQNSK